MKKKILITMLIIVILIIAVFLINFIKEKIDAINSFELDKEGKYKVTKSGINSVAEGGLGSSTSYYEIDLEEKRIDYRYDAELYNIDLNSELDKILYNKRRKLIKRYKINDSQVKEIEELFEKNKYNKLQNSVFNIQEIYYSVITKDNSFDITKEEDIKEFNNIIKSIGD